MSEKKILAIIEKAVQDEAFRKSLIEDPSNTLKENGFNLSEEVMQSLFTLTEEDYQDIKANKTVQKERVRAAGCGAGCSFGDIQVLCACGQGYFAS